MLRQTIESSSNSFLLSDHVRTCVKLLVAVFFVAVALGLPLRPAWPAVDEEGPLFADFQSQTRNGAWISTAKWNDWTTPAARIRVLDKESGLRIGKTELPATPDTVLLLHFDGDATDASRRGNDGTITGPTFKSTPTWKSKGDNEEVLYFDGVDNFVDCGNDESLLVSKAITIEAWIFPERGGTILSRTHHCCEILLGRKNAFAAYLGPTERGDPAQFTSDTPILFNTWTHVALTFDGEYVRMYVNGELKSTTPRRSAIRTVPDYPLYIGGRPANPNPNTFKGFIDEVRILKRALSPEEIAADYNSGCVKYTTDEGATWILDASPERTTTTGTDGTTAAQVCTASSLPLIVSPNTCLVRFIIGDMAGNVAESPAYPIKIDGAKDVAAAVSLADAAATITWHTRRPSISRIEYGLDTDYGNFTPIDNTPATRHRLTVPGLEKKKTYHYRIRSQYASGKEFISEDYTFSTRLDVVATHISRDPKYPNPNADLLSNNRPKPGDVLTWTGHFRNNSDNASGPFEVCWTIDGAEVHTDTIPNLPPQEIVGSTCTWTVPEGYDASDPSRHVIGCEAVLEDDNVINNARQDYMDGLTIHFIVKRAHYDEYTDETKTFEERIQYVIDCCHRAFQEAVYPEISPRGILERFRIDTFTVYDPEDYPDHKMPWRMSNNHPDYALSHITDDDAHGAGYYAYAWYGIVANIPSFLFRDEGGPLIHEMGHYRNLVDLYGWGISENLVAPGEGWNVAEDMRKDTMCNPYGPLKFCAYSAKVMNDPRYLGQPRCPTAEWVDHEVNGKKYSGYICHDIPQRSVLEVRSEQGRPIAGVDVRVYRSDHFEIQDPKTEQIKRVYGIPDTPFVSGMTNARGQFDLGEGIFLRANGTIYKKTVFFIVLTYQGKTEHTWLSTFDFNWAYWAGQTETSVHVLDTAFAQ